MQFNFGLSSFPVKQVPVWDYMREIKFLHWRNLFYPAFLFFFYIFILTIPHFFIHHEKRSRIKVVKDFKKDGQALWCPLNIF